MNTKKKGILRFFVYYDKKEKEFVGVCIDLGIIKSGSDCEEVKKDLTMAARGYVETIIKDNLPDALLNQKPPRMYLVIFKRLLNAMQKRRGDNMKSPIDMSSVQTFFQLLPVKELCLATC